MNSKPTLSSDISNGPLGRPIPRVEGPAKVAAVANAVYDATGVRITQLPVTPDKIVKGLVSNGRYGESYE
jgi:hypothetical protein